MTLAGVRAPVPGSGGGSGPVLRRRRHAAAPVALDDYGTASVSVTPAKAGSAVIGARYLGDDDYLPSDARLTQSVTAVAAAAPPPPVPSLAPSVPTPLKRAQLLSAVRIQRVVGAPARGAFTLGTITSTRLRSLAVDLSVKQASRTVLVAHAHLASRRLVARLTTAGRALLRRGKRVGVQLTLRAVDDTGHALSASRVATLRGR